MALVRTEPVRPHVTAIVLDNPSRLNSLSFALVEDLYRALATVADSVAALFTDDGEWDGGPGLGLVKGRAASSARR